MTWHRPRNPPRRGPLPRGAHAFRLPVKPHPAPEGSRDYPELAEIVERRIAVLERESVLSPAAMSTCCTERSILRRALADLPPRPVPDDVRAWMAGLVSRWGCTKKTANKYRDTVSTAYEFDRLRGGSVNNPVADVKRLRADDPLKPALTDRINGMTPVEIYRAARAKLDLRDGCALGLWYALGLRRSEVCGFEPGHFDLRDLERASVRLVQQRIPRARGNDAQPLKTERRRVLPIPSALAAEIRALLRQPAWIVPSTHGANQFDPPVRSPWVWPYNTDDLARIVEVVRSVAPDALPAGRGVHEFRHAFAEAALAYYQGNLTKVGRRLGHSNEAVTAKYARGRYGTQEIERDQGLDDALLSGFDFSRGEDRPKTGGIRGRKGGVRRGKKGGR